MDCGGVANCSTTHDDVPRCEYCEKCYTDEKEETGYLKTQLLEIKPETPVVQSTLMTCLQMLDLDTSKDNNTVSS